jgi:hypothetical protein
MASGGGGRAMAAGAIAQEPGNGRFMGGGGLTEQQTAFVEAYVSNGCKGSAAATAAGYASPRDSWRLLNNAAVIEAIRARAAVLVLAKGGTVGVGVLLEVAQDKGATAAARVSAAKWLAEAAGHGLAARKAGEVTDDDTPLDQLPLGDLEQIAHQLAAQIAATRAGLIEGEARVVARNEARDEADDEA